MDVVVAVAVWFVAVAVVVVVWSSDQERWLNLTASLIIWIKKLI